MADDNVNGNAPPERGQGSGGRDQDGRAVQQLIPDPGPLAPGVGAPPKRPVAELEEAIGYTFTHAEYLRTALVHKSYLHEVSSATSNERLEFLGDAVLDLIVSDNLFHDHPDLPEGQLSALRGTLVRLNTLAEVAAPLHLGQYLYMSRGEEAAGGRTRVSNTGRAVEAILGAVYLDGGLQAATRVWRRILGERSLEQLEDVLRTDYKSQLQQFVQAHFKVTPTYRLVNSTGPDHARQFHVEVLAAERVLGSGSGSNKQLAEQAAAKKALSSLMVVA